MPEMERKRRRRSRRATFSKLQRLVRYWSLEGRRLKVKVKINNQRVKREGGIGAAASVVDGSKLISACLATGFAISYFGVIV